MTAELAARIRALLATDTAAVTDRAMFGGVSFFLDDRMIVSARSGGDLLVRVAAERHDELASRPGAAGAHMGRRGMGAGWLTVESGAVATDADLAGWLALARENAHARAQEPAARRSPRRPGSAG
ncbi:TfoX/Sxy family protein [Cellulomonas hominis]|uniref:TfoX/Sxy family protein n=2 Tax=Cellulomonas hominis TaxID=156981 RepID=A0A7Z8K0K7_9CELL|nr:TfoX/Sxy family protein [Cellulomonas hominis]